MKTMLLPQMLPINILTYDKLKIAECILHIAFNKKSSLIIHNNAYYCTSRQEFSHTYYLSIYLLIVLVKKLLRYLLSNLSHVCIKQKITLTSPKIYFFSIYTLLLGLRPHYSNSFERHFCINSQENLSHH